MSKSGELERAVKRIIRTYNVDLKDAVKEDLERIAGDFYAQGLITQTTVDGVSMMGVAPFTLAAKLVNACQSSLVRSPQEKFPGFVAVLKNYETTEDLAEKMEAEFRDAGGKMPGDDDGHVNSATAAQVATSPSSTGGGDSAASTQSTAPSTTGMESDGSGVLKKILPSQRPQMPNSYKMNPVKGDKKRGLALIVNNVKFDKPTRKGQPILRERRGSDRDAENLHRTFTMLGYEVRTENNQTARQMRDLFTSAIQEDIKGAHDSIVICFLSHGCREGIYGVDNGVVSIEEFSTPLNNKNCAALFGKPKLFFIQACRGEGIPEVALKDKDTTLMEGDQAGDDEACELPPDSDFFFSYSTVPDTVSLRHVAEGTIYIQELCSILRNHSREYSLEEMIMRLHFQLTNTQPHQLRDRKEERLKGYLQIGQVVHTLRGPVYFM